MYVLHFNYVLTTDRYYKTLFGFLWLLHIMIADVVLCMVGAAVAYVLVELPAAKIIDYVWSFKLCSRKEKMKIDPEKLTPLLAE
jgi:hypothetical protein